MSSEVYYPTDGKESDRLAIVEFALGEGGLVDRHLRWVERGESPTSEIGDKDYGFVPIRYEDGGDTTGMRPNHEAVSLRKVATDVLHLPFDVADDRLSRRVRVVDQGWFDFLVKEQVLSPEQAVAMQEAADVAFSLDALTEDNLHTYTGVLGRLSFMAEEFNIETPFLDGWLRGIWPNEEGGHKLAMNEYGQKTGITISQLHEAGRNSQMRAGTDVDPRHVVAFFMYTTWQEFSTYLAHSRNGMLYGPVGYKLLQEMASDESRHHILYRGVLKELIKHYPDVVVRTAHSLLMSPFMPSTKGAPRYAQKAAIMDRAGIYGREQGFNAAVVTLTKLGMLSDAFDRSGLSSEGNKALDELRAKYLNPEDYKVKGAFVLEHTLKIPEIRGLRSSYEKRRHVGIK